MREAGYDPAREVLMTTRWTAIVLALIAVLVLVAMTVFRPKEEAA